MRLRVHILYFCFFFLFLQSVQAAYWDDAVFVEALFPNPVGSDTNTEWIILRNASENSIPADSLTISDQEGTTQSYVIDTILTQDSWLQISASQSGINLNNTTDAITLSAASSDFESDFQIASESLDYESAPEGMVWWNYQEDSWDWFSEDDFWAQFLAGTQVPKETAPPLQSSSDNTTSSETSEDSIQTQNSDVLPTPYSAVLPQLYQSSTNPVAKTLRFSERKPPPIDFEAEENAFSEWQHQAFYGSLGLLSAGIVFLLWTLPYWWQRYHWQL